MVVILTLSACARDIVEEVSSPEVSAIELTKTCIVANDGASGLKMSAQEAISLWEIELGNDGLDGHRYMSRIISTSSYPWEELEAKLKKVFKRLIFQ